MVMGIRSVLISAVCGVGMSRIRWAGTDYPIKYGTDVLVQATRAEMLEDDRCRLSGYS